MSSDESQSKVALASQSGLSTLKKPQSLGPERDESSGANSGPLVQTDAGCTHKHGEIVVPPLRAEFRLSEDGYQATVKVHYAKGETRPAPRPSLFGSVGERRRLLVKLSPYSCTLKLDWLDGELIGVRVDGAFDEQNVPTTRKRVFDVKEIRNSNLLNLDANAIPARARFSESGIPISVALDREQSAANEQSPAPPVVIQEHSQRRTMYELLTKEDSYVFKLRPQIVEHRRAIVQEGAFQAVPTPRWASDGEKVEPSGQLQPPNLLFVIGPHKTFTSSLVGLLNSCPDIFLLYETEPYAARPTKWALRLLKNKPELRKCFAKRNDIEGAYRTLYEHLCIRGNGFRYFGDKIATIDDGYFDLLPTFKKIVTIRDVRTWLAKDSIRKAYALDGDIVPTACQYVRFLIKSRFASDVHLIRLEDAIEDFGLQAGRISTFLGHDLKVPPQWWQTVGNYAQTEPKSLQPWWGKHPSSSIQPDRLDVTCEIAPHPFWNAMLPIFNKYYTGTPTVSSADIESDLSALAQVEAEHELAWRDAFERVTETVAI
jgi:hypothetical protein